MPFSIIVLTFFGVIANAQEIRLLEFSKCQSLLAEIDISKFVSINQVLHDARLDMCLKIIDWIIINKSSFYQPQLDEEKEEEIISSKETNYVLSTEKIFFEKLQNRSQETLNFKIQSQEEKL